MQKYSFNGEEVVTDDEGDLVKYSEVTLSDEKGIVRITPEQVNPQNIHYKYDPDGDYLIYENVKDKIV